MTALGIARKIAPLPRLRAPFRWPERLATRLSVSFVLLFVLTFAAVVLITLYYAEQNFQTSIDTTLTGLAETAAQRLDAPNADASEVANELSSLTQYVVILNARDVPIARSSNLAGIAMPSHFHVDPGNAPTFQTISNKAGRLRVIHMPIVRDGRVTGYVVVASPVPEVTDSLQSLAIVTILAGLLGLALAVIGTVWLSVRESRPLRKLAEDVKATTESGFELNIPASSAGSIEAQELRQAFGGLVQRQQEMLHRERAFFADSSHVLRTPLAVLQGDIEQLEQGVYGKERQEVVAQARNAISTMSRAVNGLLLLAREPDASPASSWEVVELSSLLTELVREAQVAAPGVSIRGEIAAGLEVAGDPNQLRDLFGNLVENAWRYTPAGGSVEVTLVRDGDDAFAEVRDTGIGISAEDLGRLKERFYRSPHARRMFPAGSGLGLAIADRVARLHGGALRLTPRASGGTVARVRLPALESAQG